MDDKLKEECGVFGLIDYEGSDVTRRIYYGLNALQHRGQESAGMAVCDMQGPKGNMSSHKGMGLVSEVFREEAMKQLAGNIGVGHVRYSTTGASSLSNAQPFVLKYLKGTLALVHNGNITNSNEIRQELEKEGAVFQGTSDSEVIACRIVKERMRTSSIEEAAKNVTAELKGGYAILIMSPRKLVGIRDPFGLKPLCLGKTKNGYVLASESAALGAVEAEFIRDIEPGEIVTITKDGIKSDTKLKSPHQAHCIFEYIYFARLDSTLDGVNVYDARIAGGRSLARLYPVEADLVSGVPDSGLVAAEGYAKESGIPFELVFQKNSYIGRTFIKPTQEERASAVHMKLSVLEHVVKGKRLVLIDDSIVRGTTMANLVKMLRAAGAKEVHVRISSPPFLYPCYYGTDIPSNSQLIANALSEEEICKKIGADSLGYMRIGDLQDMTGELPLCKACFDNCYPV